MARTVADAALLLGALTGHDFSASLDSAGLRGARIGVARKKFFGYSPGADALYELKADLATYLAAWAPGAKVKTLADVIAFNDANKAAEMPYFGQQLFLQA